jgi:hypothetical protein
MRRRQLTALAALVVGAATLGLGVALAVSEFPRGLFVLGCLAAALPRVGTAFSGAVLPAWPA